MFLMQKSPLPLEFFCCLSRGDVSSSELSVYDAAETDVYGDVKHHKGGLMTPSPPTVGERKHLPASEPHPEVRGKSKGGGGVS